VAIMKLIPIRSKSYRAALDYVKYRHDEEIKAQILDEEGNRILREDFFLSGINCSPDAFPLECMQLDAEYGKNREEDDLKMYEIIISYHPLDSQQYLLDGERAHELSMELVEKCLPGTLGIACTHTDGDHHTGNHHTHIILSSIKQTDEYCTTMDHPLDMPAGRKLFFTTSTLWELKLELQNIVRREELHQDNLFELPDVRINNNEYWVRENGQKKLDRLNEERIALGQEPEETVFRTEKQKIRDAVEEAASRSLSQDDFTDILLWEYKILVTEDNERWRYGFVGQPRSYLENTLGGNYRKRTVLEIIQENRKDLDRVAELREKKEIDASNEPAVSVQDLHNRNDCMSILFENNGESDLVLAIQDELTSGRLDGKDGLCPMEILTSLAEAALYLKENRIDSMTELDEKLETLHRNDEYHRKNLPIWRDKLRINRNKVHYAKVLERDGSLPDQLKNAEDPEKFRERYEDRLQEVEDARGYLARFELRYPVPSQKLWEEKMYSQQMVDSQKRMLRETEQELGRAQRVYGILDPMRDALETNLWIRQVLMPAFREQQREGRWEEHYASMEKRLGQYALQYEKIRERNEPEPMRSQPEPQPPRRRISYDMEL